MKINELIKKIILIHMKRTLNFCFFEEKTFHILFSKYNENERKINVYTQQKKKRKKLKFGEERSAKRRREGKV